MCCQQKLGFSAVTSQEASSYLHGWFSDVCFLLRDRADSVIFSHKNYHSQDKNNTKPAPTGLQSVSISFAKRNQGWRYLQVDQACSPLGSVL